MNSGSSTAPTPASSANPYDATPYQSFAYSASHPSRMAVLATLFGRQPATLSTARVLEIGCASSSVTRNIK